MFDAAEIEVRIPSFFAASQERTSQVSVSDQLARFTLFDSMTRSICTDKGRLLRPGSCFSVRAARFDWECLLGSSTWHRLDSIA